MQEGRGQCARGRSPVGGKICRSGQLLPGSPDGAGCGKAWFYWVFRNGTALADQQAANVVGRVARPCWSSRHVLCSGRCVIGHRCPQGADIVEIVVRAIHRRSARPPRTRSICVLATLVGFEPCAGFRRRQRFADIAADHERAARRAEPVRVAIGVDDIQSRSDRAEGPVRADRRRRRRQDQQIGIRKRARRRRHQSGAGRQRVRQARQGRRRLGQPQGTGVGAEGRPSGITTIMPHSSGDAGGDGGGSNSDPFAQALQGASSTSVTNSDGSMTTSLTYADGSKVTMTSAASGSSSSRGDIVLQFHRADDPASGQAISSATASLSVSA